MMKSSWIALQLVACLTIAGCGVADGKEIPISGKLIFESNQDARQDKVKSIYLRENGNSKKLFTGASSPRFNLDGTKLAAGRWGVGNILILSKDGELIKELHPAYYALEMGWMSNDVLFYVGTEREKISRPSYYLQQINLATGDETSIYVTAELGHIRNVSWRPSIEIFVFALSEKLAADSETTARVVFFNPKSKLLEQQYLKAFVPVLLKDNKTLVFTTNWLPNGTKIEKFAFGVLMKYDTETKEYEIIRRTNGLIRSMRLSPDGEYLFASEEVEGNGIATHIYSVDNLKEPLYVIPPMKDQYGTLSQDLQPDWWQPEQPNLEVMPYESRQ